MSSGQNAVAVEMAKNQRARQPNIYRTKEPLFHNAPVFGRTIGANKGLQRKTSAMVTAKVILS